QLVPVIIGVTLVSFLMLQLIPGDPAQVLAGEAASVEQIEQMRENLGLNEPLPHQYLSFLGNLITLDIGQSVRTDQPVVDIIAPRFWITIELAVWSILVSMFIGLFAGIISATKQYSFAD